MRNEKRVIPVRKLVLAAALLAGAGAAPAPAHAGVLCVFATEKAVVSYSLGFISGDDSSGMYATFAEGRNEGQGNKVVKPPEGQRPGWFCRIDASSRWTVTSVDDLRRRITFAPPLIPGATAMDFAATMSDANGAHTGVCEIGGPAA
jgi:hypothetical protein